MVHVTNMPSASAPSTTEDDLRKGLQSLLDGGVDRNAGGRNAKGAAPFKDPFAQTNEWEQQQRELRKADNELTIGGGSGASKWQQQMPRSRRVQQKAATASRNAVMASSTAPKLASAKSAPAIAAADRQLLPACSAWWEELKPAANDARLPDASQLAALRSKAANAYEAELGAFAIAQKRKHGKDQSIVQKLTSAGTIKDRIAALTVQVHESSFHALPHLHQLLSLAERPAAQIRLAAVEALVDLLLQRLMPPRALVPFEKQWLSALSPDGSGIAESNALLPLLQAHFESELKLLYARLVAIVEAGTKDPISHVKQRMIGTLYALLSGVPELERRLLASLVNKLGDPEKKAASRLAHLLGQLTIHHPAMKRAVLAELQRFVLRPNISDSAQ